MDLRVPQTLESGSTQDVILDCDFEIKDDQTGLEVKWFYEGEIKQVYQWLPNISKPQALGILKDRLDLDYKVSSDKNKMYRAMKIKGVTPDLTGTYTCKVSTFENEDKATKKMIIYGT